MHVRARCAGNGQQVKVTFQNYEQLVGGSKRFRNRSPAAEEYQSTHTYSFSLGSERRRDACEKGFVFALSAFPLRNARTAFLDAHLECTARVLFAGETDSGEVQRHRH
jgi:hypothetical protein